MQIDLVATHRSNSTILSDGLSPLPAAWSFNLQAKEGGKKLTFKSSGSHKVMEFLPQPCKQEQLSLNVKQN